MGTRRERGGGIFRERSDAPNLPLRRWAAGVGAAIAAVPLAWPALAPVAAAPMLRLGMVEMPTPRQPAPAFRAPAEIAGGAEAVRVRGTVGSGIYRSARAAGASPSAVQQYLRALDRQLLLEEDVLPTDAFDLVVARRPSGTARPGDLLYAGLERDGRPRVQLLRWGKDGRMQAPAELGGRSRAGFAAPLPGRITSRFGFRRHPILGYVRMHAGIDIEARHGAPVRATADGRVMFAGRHGGHGIYVRLAHAGGLGSGYAHLSRLAVSPGTVVRAGEVIGYVGSTGLSTGPHLHYELYRDGRIIDPRTAPSARTVEDAREAAAVRARLAALLRIPPTPPPNPASPSADTSVD